MPELGAAGGVLAAILTAIAAVLGGLATWRKAKNESTSSQATYIEDRLAKQEARIDALEKKNDQMEARERQLLEYIFTLQLHIQNGNPPPPPSWPLGLLPKNE